MLYLFQSLIGILNLYLQSVCVLTLNPSHRQLIFINKLIVSQRPRRVMCCRNHTCITKERQFIKGRNFVVKFDFEGGMKL